MSFKLTEADMAKLRAAAVCDHADAETVSDHDGRRVVKCQDCGCRITTFAPDYRPPAALH